MSTVTCPRCGTSNREGADVCSLCRAPLRPPEQAPAAGAPATGTPAATPQTVEPHPPLDRRRSFWDEQASNRRRSWVLMGFFVVLLAALGGSIGGAYGAARVGLLLAFGLGLVSAMVAFFSGDR